MFSRILIPNDLMERHHHRCPKCRYPDNGPNGQSYLGIYEPGKRCGDCGYREQPRVPEPFVDWRLDPRRLK